jgi:hypothetical protein
MSSRHAGVARLELTVLEGRVVPAGGLPVTVTDAALTNAVWAGTNGVIAFTRTGTPSSSLTVDYTVGGTAVPGTDYTTLSGTVTLAAGVATADVPVVALPNCTNGSNVSATISPSSAYTVGNPSSAEISVVDIPDAVTAFGGLVTTPENVSTVVPVLNLSSDLYQDGLTTTGVTQGTNGSVVLNTNGTVTYTPNAGFTGDDSFTFTVANQYGNQSTGTVSVEVDGPLAASSATWTASNTPTTVTVLSLASGPAGDTFTATGVTQGANGTVVLNGNGTATYTPNTGFTGTDSFTYTVTDAYGNPATGTVQVTVGTSVPVALNTSAATAANTAVTVPVLNSAFDPAGTSLSTSAVTQGADGAVVLNSNGTVTYTPNSGFTGNDSFTYTVADGQGNTATGTVTVSVAPVAPIALTGAASTTQNTPVTVTVSGFVSASPGDTLTVTSVTAPGDGTAVLNQDGSVTYTPASGFTGDDSFGYTVTDSFGQQSSGTVFVSVASTAPVVAGSTTVWTGAGASLNVAVLNLAFDSVGNPLSVSGVTQGANGGVVLNGNGTVTYTPDAGFTGTDLFTYTVTDGQGNSATGTVTVTAGPTAPVVSSTSATTSVGTPVSINVLSLASDPNGDPLTVTSATQGSYGSVVRNANGTILYTPNGGFTGTDTFTYTITDPYGHQTVGTATVTVGATVPVALSADASTVANTAVNVAVLNFASDPGTLSVSSVTQGADGSVAVNANGTVTYTPKAGFSGTDTFTYTVQDGDAQKATGTITVLVGGAAPAAADIQQTENVMALMTSELSSSNNVPTVLSAQSAAAQATINSYLGTPIAQIIPPGFGKLTIGIAYYTNGLAQYKKQLGVLASLDGLMSAVGWEIANLQRQLKAAIQAKPFNLALTNKLQGQIQFLKSMQTAWAAADRDLRIDLGQFKMGLDQDYKAAEMALPPDLFMKLQPPPPIPAPNTKRWYRMP